MEENDFSNFASMSTIKATVGLKVSDAPSAPFLLVSEPLAIEETVVTFPVLGSTT